MSARHALTFNMLSNTNKFCRTASERALQGAVRQSAILATRSTLAMVRADINKLEHGAAGLPVSFRALRGELQTQAVALGGIEDAPGGVTLDNCVELSSERVLPLLKSVEAAQQRCVAEMQGERPEVQQGDGVHAHMDRVVSSLIATRTIKHHHQSIVGKLNELRGCAKSGERVSELALAGKSDLRDVLPQAIEHTVAISKQKFGVCPEISLAECEVEPWCVVVPVIRIPQQYRQKHHPHPPGITTVVIHAACATTVR